MRAKSSFRWALFFILSAIFILFIADEKIKRTIPEYLNQSAWFCLVLGIFLLIYSLERNLDKNEADDDRD